MATPEDESHQTAPAPSSFKVMATLPPTTAFSHRQRQFAHSVRPSGGCRPRPTKTTCPIRVRVTSEIHRRSTSWHSLSWRAKAGAKFSWSMGSAVSDKYALSGSPDCISSFLQTKHSAAMATLSDKTVVDGHLPNSLGTKIWSRNGGGGHRSWTHADEDLPLAHPDDPAVELVPVGFVPRQTPVAATLGTTLRKSEPTSELVSMKVPART